jgi:hypothetical protein
MEEKTIEELCADLRTDIESIKCRVANLHDHDHFKTAEDRPLEGGNVPKKQHPNMHANITLAFRHMEDARMRLGKVLQAYQGGISILDRK